MESKLLLAQVLNIAILVGALVHRLYFSLPGKFGGLAVVGLLLSLGLLVRTGHLVYRAY